VTALILAIDVGNTEIVLGLGGEDGWTARWRLATVANRTADEYGVLVADLFARAGRSVREPTGIVVTSVVPCLTPVVTELCQRLFGRSPLVVGPGVRTGMPVRYQPPAALGSDRLVDAVAARARFGAPVVVVDFGTATTFNVVDAAGAFIGGAIAPGVGVAAEALARAGARLSRIELASGDGLPVVGRNTEQSMRSGVLYGFAGLVAGMLGRTDAELAGMGVASRAPAVATGGMSRLIAPLVPRITAVVPDLTLDGLRLLFELNRP
jgi:type III pantothenate kinase